MGRTASATVVALAAVVVASGVLAGGSGAASRTLPYEDAKLPVRVRVADLLAHDPGGEGWADDAGRTWPVTTTDSGSPHGGRVVLSGGGSMPTTNTPRAWANMVDRFQTAALGRACASRSSTGSTRCTATATCSAPPCSPTTSDSAPRVTRSWCGRRTTGGRGDARHGPQWAFAPCVCVARDDRWGRTYESFGEDPDLVSAMETAIDGFQGPPGHLAGTTACSPRPSTTLATATPSTAPQRRLPDRPGDHDHQPPDFRRDALAPVRPRRAPARRRHRCAVVLERRLDRGRGRQPDQDARQPRADHRAAEGGGRLSRLRDQRLGGDSPAPGLAHVRCAPASRPGSTCSWSPTTTGASRTR